MSSINGAITGFGRLPPQAALLAKRLRQIIGVCMTRRRERLALAELDHRLLRDIGTDRLTARFEAERPFWEGRERRRGWWS